jgi:hypothetical protein
MIVEERTERLGIWFADVEKLPPQMRLEILPHLDLTRILRVGQGEKNEEQPALAFKCPLLQAALICDLIRSHDRAVGARPSEIYLNRSGEETAWRRVVYSMALTVMVNGKAMLNPELFVGVNVVPPSKQVRDGRPIRIGKS